MLDETLFRIPRREGLHLLQRRGERGARELTTHRVTLSAGASADLRMPGEETVVVLQEGTGRLLAGGRSWDVSRQGVFSGPATALLVPPDMPMRIEADTPLEAVAVSTPAPAGGGVGFCAPDQVEVTARGRDDYAREVHSIFVSDPHGRRLMVGETFNPPGKWSSYPPHKHDGRDGEPVLEEAYYFRIDPPPGFGQHVLYTADGESVSHQVRDGDLVLIPYGYHTVAAAPGYRLYYLWAIAGQQRKLAIFMDPAHRWIEKP